MLKHSKRILALLGAIAAVALVWAGLTLAKPPKPPQPPPLPPAGASSGTIFYCEQDKSGLTWISRMNWDGTGATPLYSGVPWMVTGWDVSHSDTSTSHRFLIYEDTSPDALYVVDLWDPNLTPRCIHGTDSFYASDARLSHDDHKVAFLGVADGLFDGYLYVADLEKDGNGVPTGIDEDSLVQVAYVGIANGLPTWSPDNNYIAFQCGWSDDSWTNGDIYVVSVATGEVTNITNTPCTKEYYPDWSPVLQDGTSRIAFHAWDLPRKQKTPINIYTVLPDGSDRTLAVSEANSGSNSNVSPSWSPDGEQIAIRAYTANKYAVMRSAAGGGTTAMNLTGWGKFWGAVKWRPSP